MAMTFFRFYEHNPGSTLGIFATLGIFQKHTWNDPRWLCQHRFATLNLGMSPGRTQKKPSRKIINESNMGMGQNPGTPSEPQNSWDLWMFIPLICIGIDP